MTRISVVLVADDVPQVERYVRDLAADPAADEIELVLVGPSSAPPMPPDDLTAGLGGVQVLTRDDHRMIHRGRLDGARAARSPAVLLAETHAWPAPGSVIALAARIEGGAAAAGPLMQNANPGTRRSWAAFLLDYGRWWAGVSEDADGHPIPGHSSAFARDVVLESAGDDPDAFRIPFLLAERLMADGHRVVLAGDARTAHLNADRLRAFAGERLVSGRFFGAERSRRWSAARRGVYAAGSPLIVPLRAWRMTVLLRRTVEGRRILRHAGGALLAGIVLGAVGEGLGYVTGRSDDEREAEYELAKVRYASALGTPA